MDDSADIKNLSPEQLKQYITEHHVSDYLIVDVRQPFEYTAGHIPGATFMPLTEVETKLFELPEDKDLIFYCHSGGRSMAAAMLAAEAEVTQKSVKNLIGGIMAWDGNLLEGLPKIEVFDATYRLEEYLYKAMDLEKGAWRFYTYTFSLASSHPVLKTFDKLSKAETGHAKVIYGFWKTHQSNAPSFDQLFEDLNGDIIEGGEPLKHALTRLEKMSETPCINLIEMALHIEYSAFDLYRTMAEKATDPKAKEAFLIIAQAEKNHIKLLINAIGECQV